MKPFAIAAAAMLCSTACASLSPDEAGEGGVRSLSYETSACEGQCPVYRFTVRRDGAGTFEGRRHTAVIGQRSFHATAAQFQALLRHLELVRPDHGSLRIQGATCPDTQSTDQPGVEIVWHEGGGEAQRLYYDYGCAPVRLRELAERVGTAPFLLPIGDLIGRR